MTTSTRLDTRLAELLKARAERLDPLDMPRTWTMRQINTYSAETLVLDQQLGALRAAADTLARLPIDADVAWRDHLIKWRAVLESELLAIPTPTREKADQDRARRFAFDLRLIDRGFGSAAGAVVDLSGQRLGELMHEAHYHNQGEALRSPNGWRGSLPETEHRLTFMTTERTKAEQVLNNLLMTDAERAQQETAIVAFRVTLNVMDIRGDASGRGLVAFTEDGDPLRVDDMTPEQQRAFRWFESVARATEAAPELVKSK